MITEGNWLILRELITDVVMTNSKCQEIRKPTFLFEDARNNHASLDLEESRWFRTIGNVRYCIPTMPRGFSI